MILARLKALYGAVLAWVATAASEVKSPRLMPATAVGA